MAVAEPVTCTMCELHAEAFFRVEGMDCSEEVIILERRLKPLAGVEALSADVLRQRLHVKYDAAKLTTSEMVDAVGQAGMRMWLEHEEPTSVGSDVRLRSRLMAGSGAAIATGFLCSVGTARRLHGLSSFEHLRAVLCIPPDPHCLLTRCFESPPERGATGFPQAFS